MSAPIFTRPDGRELPPTHHLAVNQRGKYVIRGTVYAGEKFVGKRVSVQTDTRDLALARIIRDAVVIGWIKAGNLCREIVLEREGGP